MARILKFPAVGTPAAQWPALARHVVVLGIAGVLGLAGGLLSAMGRPELMAIFAGLVVAAMIMSSRRAVFWFVVVGALVVVGVAQLYLPGSRHLRYVIPLASGALLLHWITDYLAARQPRPETLLPGPIAWGVGFLLLGVASVAMNLADPGVAAMGTKNYFQMWPFFFGVALLRWQDGFDRRLYQALLLIALLQLPFVAHQYLVLMPRRVGLGHGVVPADVIAGTFGASLLGGGANAVLAAFQVIVVGVLLALWKNGALSTLRVAILVPLLLSPLLVNQAKVSVLYLVLMFVVLFWREVLVRPGKFILASAGMAAGLAALMTALMLTHPTGALQSWSAVVENVIVRQTASIEERRGQYAELSRWTALTFWAQEHVSANPANTLLGHGLGASREPDGTAIETGNTLAQRKYPGLRIGYTAVSALLWDTGLLGTAAVLGMFAAAFFMAGRLAGHYRYLNDPFRTGLFEGLQAAMAVLALSLAHKDFFVVHIPFQACVYLLIGFIANSWLRIVQAQGVRRERTGL